MEPYGHGIRKWGLGSDVAHMEGRGGEGRGGLAYQADAAVSTLSIQTNEHSVDRHRR